MEDSPVVRTAAFIGEVFKIDPLRVLDCSIEDWHIRLAAYKVIQKAYEKRNAELSRGK